MLKKSNHPIYFALAFSLLVLLSFQNCGDVNVPARQLPSVEPEAQAFALPQGAVRSGTGNQFGTPVRFTFIVDMSLSNLGGSMASNYNQDTRKYQWTLGLFEPFDPAQPELPDITDVMDNPFSSMSPRVESTTTRFDAVKNFINSCGNSPEFQYSIIGFSNEALFGDSLKTCDSPYESGTDSLMSLEKLRQVQRNDIARNGVFDHQSPFVMGMTAYNKALSCLGDNVRSNIALGDQSILPIYQVFFLTDGKPSDFNENVVEQKAKYREIMQSLLDFGLPRSAGMRMNTIYYGPDSERDRATDLLNAIAQTTDPNNITQYVDNFPALTESLCQLYQPQATYAYRSYQTSSVNINRLQKGDHFEADSDADGVADSEEPEADRLNPRSRGVLDVLCKRSGAGSACAPPAGCTQEFVGLGLTDCDVKFASAYFGKNLSGYDSDGDQVADFIEIIKGSNPAINDMQSDNDKDGISNIREIINGTDLNDPAVVDAAETVRVSLTKTFADSVTNEELVKFTFNQAPVKTGQAYTDARPGQIDFSHKADENVYLFINMTEPRGTTALPNRMNALKINVSTSQNPVLGENVLIGDFAR